MPNMNELQSQILKQLGITFWIAAMQGLSPERIEQELLTIQDEHIRQEFRVALVERGMLPAQEGQH